MLNKIPFSCNLDHVVLQNNEAPADFYANGSTKITFESMAFTSEWIHELRHIKRASLMMTDDEIWHTYIFNNGPEMAFQVMRYHEWCPPAQPIRNQYRGQNKPKQKKKSKVHKESNMNKAINSG